MRIKLVKGKIRTTVTLDEGLGAENNTLTSRLLATDDHFHIGDT